MNTLDTLGPFLNPGQFLASMIFCNYEFHVLITHWLETLAFPSKDLLHIPVLGHSWKKELAFSKQAAPTG